MSDSIAEALSIEEVEIVNILGEPEHISEKEMSFWCPKCNPPHHKPKLFVNRYTFDAHCFVCGFASKGGVESLAWRLGKKTDFKGTPLGDDILGAVMNALSHHEKSVKDPGIPYGVVNMMSAPKKEVVHGKMYLRKRGITDEDMIRWRMMFGYLSDPKPKRNMRGRVVFPSFGADGKLEYYVGRASWKPPSDATFFMSYKDGPPGVFKRDIIFNEVDINWNYPVVLVEGIFDAIPFNNGIPLLGKTLLPHWKLFQKLIEEDAPVILMLDGDAHAEQHKIATLLKQYGLSDLRCVWLPEDMDPGSLKRSRATDYLQYAKAYDGPDLLTRIKRLVHGNQSEKEKVGKRDLKGDQEALEEEIDASYPGEAALLEAFEDEEFQP